MEQILSSNSISYLSGKLAEDLKESTSTVFNRTTIITQSTGMQGWLKTELAFKNRIFANFEFQNQDGLFSAIYKLLFGEVLKNNTDILRYRVYDALGKEEFKKKFEQVGDYYKGDDLRRMQLATRVADLFDQYQLYRDDMIETWGKGKLMGNHEAEPWQLYLWRQLDMEPKANIRDRIYEKLEESKDLVKKVYPQIFVFGISIYTEFHLQFLKRLAKITDLHFYVVLPTEGNGNSNELLVNYGTKARELSAQFPESEFHHAPSTGNTLLSHIQENIKKDKQGTGYVKDGSIRINSCYTAAREAECLYNYLLKQFASDSTLEPGDVMVLTTDINKYAPYIKAVFKNAPKPIPFRISGEDNNTEDSMVAALELLLSFTEDELTSERVVSLLEHKRIKRAFRIEDTDYIRQVVRKGNIRFGWENRQEDDTQYVSWKYGLEKIILGYAIYSEEEYTNAEGVGLFPFMDAEAAKSHDLFRLKAFVDGLMKLLEVRDEKKSLVDWKLFMLEEVLDKMIFKDDFEKDDRLESAMINRALSFMDRLEISEEVPYQVFLEELKMKLFTESREVQLNTGFVTVTPPVPVRGIPSRIICFLGLNNDVFPRKDRFPGFDLMGEDYRPGDRSKLENDKFIFLDTLLAAKDKLYLSYIGQSVKDNETIPPSIVVDTLLDYVEDETLVVKHPLHGFSTKYNSDQEELYTYFYSEEKDEFELRESGEDERKEISVRSFVKFFEHPIQWYFNEVLGIYYKKGEDSLSETEIMDMDPLQKWQVKKDLMSLNSEEEIEAYINHGIKEGILPLKSAAHAVIEDLSSEIKKIRESYGQEAGENEARDVPIDFNIDGIRINGLVEDVFDRKYITYAFSDKPKYKIRAWVSTLLLSAAGMINQSIFINSKGNVDQLTILNRDDAKDSLRELMAYLELGSRNPLKFTANAAKKVIDEKEVENIFLEEADPPPFSKVPPDPYVKYLYENDRLEEFEIINFSKRDFNKEVYNEERFEDIKTLGGLLTITNEQI